MEQGVREQLTARLTEGLEKVTAAQLAGAMDRAGHAAAALALLDELRGASAKAAQGAVEALPELQRRGGLPDVVAWLDLGVALAGSSGSVTPGCVESTVGKPVPSSKPSSSVMSAPFVFSTTA